MKEYYVQTLLLCLFFVFYNFFFSWVKHFNHYTLIDSIHHTSTSTVFGSAVELILIKLIVESQRFKVFIHTQKSFDRWMFSPNTLIFIVNYFTKLKLKKNLIFGSRKQESTILKHKRHYILADSLIKTISKLCVNRLNIDNVSIQKNRMRSQGKYTSRSEPYIGITTSRGWNSLKI